MAASSSISAATNAAARSADPASLYDNSFVQQLDQSGFIDGLYR